MSFLDEHTTPISKDTDVETFQKIVRTLCEKRDTLEKKIKASSSPDDTHELLQLVEEMETFGISELEYQKYLISK